MKKIGLVSWIFYVLGMWCISTYAASSEFQINSHTTYDQSRCSIASDANGNFIIVWHSYRQDGDSNGIFGKRFGSDGVALGNEFQVNQQESGNQKSPAVAMSDEGNFSVVWQGPGGDGDDIFCRRYSSDGNAIGNEFIVNSITAADQVEPAIAMGKDGDCIVVWISEDVPEPNMKAVCGQSYDSNGASIGGEIRINDQNSVCRYPAVVLNDSNEAIVVWVRQSSSQSIWTRHSVINGNKPNTILSKKVNESPAYSSLTEPDICIDNKGNYVIAWDGDVNNSSEDNIYIRYYHNTHAGANEEHKIDTGLQSYCQNPSVIHYADNQFVVLWEGDEGVGWTEKDIYGQMFTVNFEHDNDVNPIGGIFAVNNYLANEQRHVEAVSIGEGKFTIGWQSDEQDGSRDGIFGRLGPVVSEADIDGDGFVNFIDYCLLADQWYDDGAGLVGDIVIDGQVSGDDLSKFGQEWLKFRYDSNEVDVVGEPIINLVDFAILAENWRKTGLIKGDIDNDGIVGYSDLGWMFLQWCNSSK